MAYRLPVPKIIPASVRCDGCGGQNIQDVYVDMSLYVERMDGSVRLAACEGRLDAGCVRGALRNVGNHGLTQPMVCAFCLKDTPPEDFAMLTARYDDAPRVEFLDGKTRPIEQYFLNCNRHVYCRDCLTTAENLISKAEAARAAAV